MRISSLFYIFFICHCWLTADEYLYPIAQCTKKDQSFVLVQYQQSMADISLWLWDPASHSAQKILFSIFKPANIKLLPDQLGFSFIDNGRIKIKYFNKRSPKSIDIYDPIRDIAYIEWADAHHCYFQAKLSNLFRILQSDLEGQLVCIVCDNAHHCLFGQKIGENLYYIARSKHPLSIEHHINYYHHMIMQTTYPSINYSHYTFNSTEKFDERVKAIMQEEQNKNLHNHQHTEKKIILDCGAMPIAFLRMINDAEGYFIEYPAYIDTNDPMIEFSYHKITRSINANSDWKTKKLFSFHVPSHLLVQKNEDSLFESLLPLLPYHDDTKIYFSDSHQTLYLDLYEYDQLTEKVQKLTNADKQQFFSPIKINSTLVFGGTIMDNAYQEAKNPLQIKSSNLEPSISIKDDSLQFNFPNISNNKSEYLEKIFNLT